MTHFRDDLLTGMKHPAFSTNHLADTDKTKHNDNQEQNKNARKLLTYAQTKPNKKAVQSQR